MIAIRKSEERGMANHGWLDAKHSFSFGQYYDPNHTGFRDLVVINEDKIEPDSGFAPHPHKDMEIITYIIDGAIEHEDSIGNKGIIKKGEIQRMSAGSGIRHSEVNPSKTEKTHLLQIWIQTASKGIEPDYEDVQFGSGEGLSLLVSPQGGEKQARINQDFKLYGGNLKAGKTEELNLDKKRHAWIQLVDGELELNGEVLSAGDGAAVSEETLLKIRALKDSEFLLMDLK